MDVAVSGFFAGLSLIVAIGAQNAYVLRLGLARNHVAVAVGICATADVVLILAGVAGVGAIVRPSRCAGRREVGRVRVPARLRAPLVLAGAPARGPAARRRTAPFACCGGGPVAAFTFLNPHVYLDTVLLLGSIGNQDGDEALVVRRRRLRGQHPWFCSLGFGATAAARLMSRPVTWRVLDIVIGVVMLLIAVSLLRSDLG